MKIIYYVRGFTLVEVLAVLSILAILLLAAIPATQYLITQNRTLVQANTLVEGLQYARLEAITRGEKLKFCKSSNHQTCGGSWREGQIILNSKEQVLRIFSAIPQKDNLVWNSSGGLDDFIIWSPMGYTYGQRGTFYYCAGNNNTSDSRNIVLSDSGRVYVVSMSATDYSTHCK